MVWNVLWRKVFLEKNAAGMICLFDCPSLHLTVYAMNTLVGGDKDVYFGAASSTVGGLTDRRTQHGRSFADLKPSEPHHVASSLFLSDD